MNSCVQVHNESGFFYAACLMIEHEFEKKFYSVFTQFVFHLTHKKDPHSKTKMSQILCGEFPPKHVTSMWNLFFSAVSVSV